MLEQILTIKFLEHALAFLAVVCAFVFVWLVIDGFKYFIKKHKRNKKSKDGGFLRWM